MNTKIFIASVLLACGMLQACGKSHHSTDTMTPAPAPSGNQTFDTPQVVTLTQASSETDDPLAVNDGKVTLTGSTDEASDPVKVIP